MSELSSIESSTILRARLAISAWCAFVALSVLHIRAQLQLQQRVSLRAKRFMLWSALGGFATSFHS
eukprot:18913-Heterococcus_DN1.PRE.2